MGWLEGGVCGGRAATAAQRVQGWASPGSVRHWTLSGKGLNSSCGGTSFCCLWPEEGESENFQYHRLTVLTPVRGGLETRLQLDHDSEKHSRALIRLWY